MRSVVLALVLLAAWDARADPDEPKSTISEWPPKPKPKPPAPPPPPPAPPPGTPTPGAPTPGAPTPGAPTTTVPPPPGVPGAPGSPPTTIVPPPPGVPPAAKPPASPGTTVPAAPNSATPKPGAAPSRPAPLVGSPFHEIDARRAAAIDTRPGVGQPIVEIKVADNTKTDTVTVEYIAGVHLGELLDQELLDRVRQNLLSSDLFKDVLVYFEPDVVAKDGSTGVRLIISAKDKLSWIIAPLFFYSERNIGGGAAFAHANLFGHNKKMLAAVEYSTAEKLLFLAYLDPQIRDSRFYFRVDFLLRRDNIVEYGTGQNIGGGDPRVVRATDVDTLGGAVLTGVNFTRRFHLDLRLKLYYDRVNPSECYNTTNDSGFGTPDVVARQGGYCRQPSSSGWDNTLTVSIGYDGRAKIQGVQSGLLLNAQWQYGASWLGTRWDYHLLSAWGLYAWRFFKQHNLVLRAGFDLYLDPPFKQEIETGGATMRGFLYRQFRGDTDARASLEYLLPLFTISGFSLRLVGFYDTNLTWFRDLPPQNGPLARFVRHGNGFRDYLPDTPSGLVRDSWHNGVGGGIRMYLTGVVLPLIGVDFAYGIESNAFQIYLALGSTLGD